MPGNFDVLQPVLAGIDDNIGGDGVAGLELIDLGGRLEGVGHDHRVHKAGDGFVVDVGHAGILIQRQNFSLEGVAFRRGGSSAGWSLRFFAVAGCGEGEQSAQAEQCEPG